MLQNKQLDIGHRLLNIAHQQGMVKLPQAPSPAFPISSRMTLQAFESKDLSRNQSSIISDELAIQ